VVDTRDASVAFASVLVPELDVTTLAASLRFYREVLGFRVLFERPVERFAYLERDGVELMLQEAAGPGRRVRTAALERPCGRGVNFQLRVEDVDTVHARAVAAGVEVVVPIEERWYRVDATETGGRWQSTRADGGRQPSVRARRPRRLPLASVPRSRAASLRPLGAGTPASPVHRQVAGRHTAPGSNRSFAAHGTSGCASPAT
jgi:catechol 2,3-dioxygenase-like lactoylglutathione lyase family enzyme